MILKIHIIGLDLYSLGTVYECVTRLEKQQDKLIMLEKASSLELTIKMPCELQEQTQQLAMQQSKTVSEIIHIALRYYLDNYQESNQPVSSELNLEQGRNLMRELGLGLGHSTSPSHDVARNHDLYLYQK